MNCPNCNKPMKNLGNVSGVVLTSMPPQWDTVYVCEADKVKKTVREHGQMYEKPDLSDFKEI